MRFEKLAARGAGFLGVKYPIISGGMTWISNFELVSAVSENGAFPVFAGGNAPAEVFEREIDRCIENIKTPFAVNLVTIAPNYKSQYEVLLSKKAPFVVFAGGIPKKSEILRMKESGKKTMSFAAEESIAEQQIKYGIDALILEGSEAGGHIGHVSLTILIQQVLFGFGDTVPIFVGGGIAKGGIMAHLMLMGAAGCQLGTRFVMSRECTAHENFKNAFLKARARQASSTPQYDSKLPVVAVRAIKNKGSEEFGKLQLKLLKRLEEGAIGREEAQFEVENFWTGSLRRAVVEGDIEYGSLMAGQSVGLINDILPMKKIIETLVEEAETELEKIAGRLGEK